MNEGERIRKAVWDAAADSRLRGPATSKQIGYMNSLLEAAIGRGAGSAVARHQVLEHLFKRPSSKDLTKAEASVVIDWLSSSEDAQADVHAVLKAWGVEHGQLELGI